jgi:hypothetical protein
LWQQGFLALGIGLVIDGDFSQNGCEKILKEFCLVDLRFHDLRKTVARSHYGFCQSDFGAMRPSLMLMFFMRYFLT